MIPKKIFTFWDGSDMPNIVKKCIEKMRSINPGWEIVVLTRKDILDELPCLQFLSMTHQSDWARVCALQQHGGVWLDASCICLKPVTSWVDMQSTALQGFSPPFDERLFENWAFAAPKNSEFMNLWKEQVREACIQGHEAYCSSIPDNIVGNLRPSFLPYLSMHAGFCVVHHANPHLQVIKRPSCEENMPFHYLCANDWDVDRAIKTLTKASLYSKHAKTVMIKMRGEERLKLADKDIDRLSLIGRLSP